MSLQKSSKSKMSLLGRSPRVEKISVSVFLPNEHSMDDWFAAVYALPTIWPDVSIMETNNLRKMVRHDFPSHAEEVRKCLVCEERLSFRSNQPEAI